MNHNRGMFPACFRVPHNVVTCERGPGMVCRVRTTNNVEFPEPTMWELFCGRLISQLVYVGISVLLKLHTSGDTTCRPVTRSDIEAHHPFSV